MNIKKEFKIFLAVLSVILITTLGVYAFSFRNMTLDFVQVSDTHISFDRPSTNYKALSSSKILLKDMVEQINAIQGLDFVMFTGDMVDAATEENYEMFYRTISKLKYPSLNTFGSHDYNGMSEEEVLSIVKDYNKNYIFDKTYYAITPKTDYRIIVLDPTIIGTNTSNGRLSREQLTFLDKELNENQDKIILIAMHYPSVQPFVSPDHALINADEFNEILLKYKNPIVVISGHYHAAKIRRMGNLVFVSTPSTVTYPMAARHIKIVNFKDRVQYKFDFIDTRLKDLKEQNRQTVISFATLAGAEKDRNLEFTYYKKRPKSPNYKRKKIAKAQKTSKVSKRELKKLLNQDTPKTKKEKKKKSDTKDKQSM